MTEYWMAYMDEQPWGLGRPHSTRGRAPKGEVAVAPKADAKAGLPRTATFIGCVSPMFGALAAEYVHTTTVKAPHILAVVRRAVARMHELTDHERSQGREVKPWMLLMDNCRTHHASEILEYLTSNNVGYKFNAPFSPMFNPIESVFSNMAISMKCNWHREVTVLLDEDGKTWKKVDPSWAQGRALIQAFKVAAAPRRVRQYEHGMLRFVRAAQALMPLTIAGDAPSEEQVAAWEQQVEEKRREVMQAEVLESQRSSQSCADAVLTVGDCAETIGESSCGDTPTMTRGNAVVP